MKTTVSQILNGKQVIEDLIQLKLKFGTMYKLKKLVIEINEVLKEFEESRIAALKENAVLNEETNQYEFDKEDKTGLEAFNKVFQEMLNAEIELKSSLINPEELAAVDDLEIEMAAMDAIEWILDEAA